MRRRILVVLGGLLLLGLGLAVVIPYAQSRWQLRAAEQALQAQDLEAAQAHLQRSLVVADDMLRVQTFDSEPVVVDQKSRNTEIPEDFRTKYSPN